MSTTAVIVVQSGGSADQGQSVNWQNTSSQKVKVTGLAGIVPNGEFHVNPSANGKSGEHLGSVLPNAPTGDHPYTITDEIADTTATLHVDSSMPKPK